MSIVYNKLMEFERKYPGGISWRKRKHCAVIEQYLGVDEEVDFAFAAQKNNKFYDIFSTCVFCLTNKRVLIAKKRLLWGSFLTAITPDLYNDTEIYRGLVWGKVTIDTIKEVVVLSNVSKSGLGEIEKTVSEFMMKEKKKYIDE